MFTRYPSLVTSIRILMALPTFNDLKGLDVSFNGEPFCNISTGTGSLNGLDTAYNGEPFSGTEAPGGGSNVKIQPDPGIVTSSGVFAGIKTRLPSAPGAIASSGVCGDIEIIESGIITPPAGIVMATGLLSGIRTELPPTLGRIDAIGIYVSVATASIVSPAPGLISASGTVPWIGQKICTPTAQIAGGADISGLLCVLTAIPAMGLLTGGITCHKCVSEIGRAHV